MVLGDGARDSPERDREAVCVKTEAHDLGKAPVRGAHLAGAGRDPNRGLPRAMVKEGAQGAAGGGEGAGRVAVGLAGSPGPFSV